MARIVIVGQAPPARLSARPFGRTRLYDWLTQVGIDDVAVQVHFHFAALIDYFPGKVGGAHVVPSYAQIRAGRSVLANNLLGLRPDMIVPVGGLAIREALCTEVAELAGVIGQRFIGDPFGVLGRQVPIIPLPHPSGASTWIYSQGNHQLLRRALLELKREFSRIVERDGSTHPFTDRSQ